ncbi:hypothetical protein PYW07_015872 [Mythimna separata]|uniref:Uncharacterized protein n=1 Tax=Mythimna separata TaxID=271217 RepID=A0AAD8DUT9_MYTSE|nr:hypothetical protein PYW07_015872 [Mythimna separata]
MSTMLIRCGLLLLCLNCVRTNQYFVSDGDQVAEFNRRFSLWPSVHNAARLLRVRRQAEAAVLESEGGSAKVAPVDNTSPAGVANPAPAAKVNDGTVQSESPPTLPATGSGGNNNINNSTTNNNNSTVNNSTIVRIGANETKTNATLPVKPVKQIDLNSPGVLKRGFIVFGGFALLAVAYFIFYRRKSKNNDSGGAHTTIDANQFRYGVLQSEDRRDNMELSRVPLTMESDEDEDEDLEIFDLEQKKKSLSYVNLQTNDEDIVFPKDSTDNDRDNLLLDIEDGNSDTLINWSSNGSKSIL